MDPSITTIQSLFIYSSVPNETSPVTNYTSNAIEHVEIYMKIKSLNMDIKNNPL